MTTPAARPRLTPGLLVTLGALGGVGLIGTNAFLPALPTMAEDLDSTPSGVLLALTGFTAGMAAGQVLAGPISDAVGRRGPLLIGAAGMVLAALSAALAPTVLWLILSCAVMGLFSAVGSVVSRATVSDLAEGPALTRAYAWLGTLPGIGPVVGPLVGVALLLAFGWRGIFAGLAVAGAACLMTALIVLPESHPRAHSATGGMRKLGVDVVTIFRSRTFLGFAAVIWLVFVSLFAYISASSFIVQNVLGLSEIGYTVVFALNGAGMILAAVATARLSSRVSGHVLSAIGIGLQTVGAGCILISSIMAEPVGALLLPGMLFIAMSWSFVAGPCSAAALADLRHASGTALAVIGSLQFLLAGLVAPLLGAVGDNEVLPLGIISASCALLAWFVWWASQAHTRSVQPADG